MRDVSQTPSTQTTSTQDLGHAENGNVSTQDHAYVNKSFTPQEEHVECLERPRTLTAFSLSPEEMQNLEKRKSNLANEELSKRRQSVLEREITRLERLQVRISEFTLRYGQYFRYAVYALLITAYAVYFGYAVWYGSFATEDDVRLFWITMLVFFFCVVDLVRYKYGESISNNLISPLTSFIRNHWSLFKWGFVTLVLAGIVAILVVEVVLDEPRNLVSLVGYFLYIFLIFVFSLNPTKVRWRPVFWGLGLQFVFAMLTLRTEPGYQAFKWLGDRVQEFMKHTDAGSIFVFGESYEDHAFAFKVLPNVIFFSTAIAVLYYLGAMQMIILKLAWLMQSTMGTTPAESINAAGNIFIGQTEAPLLIRPFINRMTLSEIHAVMVGGFSTIAGSVMATYILFGVPANHLITASVMAAPCALAMSKLACPETEEVQASSEEITTLTRSKERNVIEAASSGASASIKLVANIAVNILAFIALLEFVNRTLEWFGERVGLKPPEYEPLTFQFICSYIFWPLAFVMGVAVNDCRKVGELMGMKVFINEFVAYTALGEIIDNSLVFNDYNGTWTEKNNGIYLVDTNTTLVGGVMEDRSIVISTYALCGFANVASIGMVIGVLGAMAPSKKTDLASFSVRSMVIGNMVSCMNACIAGLLYKTETV